MWDAHALIARIEFEENLLKKHVCKGNYYSLSPNKPLTRPVGPVGISDPKKGPWRSG
jgi:hypothetical protein